MLWRASQIFGHLHRAALQITGRGQLVHPLLYASFRKRWMSAALALQARALFNTPTPQSHPRRSRESAHASKPKPSVSTGGKREAVKPHPNAFRRLPQPPAHLVKIVDALFRRRRQGDCTLNDLRAFVENSEVLSHLEDKKKASSLAVLMVNTGVPQRACRVLLLAHAFGCTFKQSVYESVAYQLSQTGQWAFMPALVALGRRQTGRTTTRLLNWRARALVEISHFGLLDRVLDQFEEAQVQPNRQTYHVLVSGHLRNRDLGKVKECLGWMEEAGFPMDASTHALLVSNYRALGPDPTVRKQAMNSMQELGERNATAVVNSLIQLSLDTGDVRNALKYLSLFDTPYPNSSGTREHGDRTLERGGERETPADPPSGGPILSPDIATFTMLTNYAARMRNLPLAQQMIDRMVGFRVRADEIFVAALVRVYCACGDLPTALNITALTCHHNRAAMSILRRLGLEKVEPHPVLQPGQVTLSTRIVNALLRGVLETRGLKGMQDVRELFRSANLELDHETVEVFMSYLSYSHASPRQLIRTLRMIPSHLQPTLRHVHILVRTILGKEIAAVNPRGWQMISTPNGPPSPPPSQPISGFLASSWNDGPKLLQRIASSILYRKPSYAATVRRIVQSLASRSITPDRATVHLSLRHDALVKRNMERAKQMLSVMLKRGMHPNEYHYAAIMEGYSLTGLARSAEKVLWRAREAGFAKDPVLFTIVIHGYACLRLPEEAARVFKAMLQEDIEPDVGSVDALASAYYAVRAYAAARRVLLQFWERFAPFPPGLTEASLKTLADAFRQLSPQTPVALSKQSRRMFRFKLKKIAQNSGKRRRRGRIVVRVGTKRRRRGSRQDVLVGTSHNKHTILQ